MIKLVYWAIVLFLFSCVIETSQSKAQNNDFFRFDTNYPSRSLFPSVDGRVFNIKDLVDDGSIQRVVTILQSNIKQWSFIESQLLEPNVNLGMPEIFIPLRHLTTTLEVLGNIIFMRDDIVEAKNSLERACPLMELLPPAVNEDQRYAVGCFALLREVYGKLYNIGDGTTNNGRLGIGMGNEADDDPDHQSNSERTNKHVKKRGSKRNKPVDMTDDDDDDDDRPDNDGDGSMDREGDHERTDHDHESTISDDERGLNEDVDDYSDGEQEEGMGTTRHRRKGRRSRKHSRDRDRDNSRSSSSSSSLERKASTSGTKGDASTSSKEDPMILRSQFDIDKRFEELRAPYDHLRTGTSLTPPPPSLPPNQQRNRKPPTLHKTQTLLYNNSKRSYLILTTNY